MKDCYQIAVDGPAGSGKSTIARLLAKKLGFLYIDSGAMYRAVTLYMLRNNLLKENENKLKKYLTKIKINFINKKGKQLIYLNSNNVTNEIRSSQISKLVSEVSTKKVVRKEMIKRQRNFARAMPVIMDGRDIGSVVFQNAKLKIYLTASVLIRAKRRKKDLKKLSERIKLGNMIKQIYARDNYDSNRALAPLCKAQDAVVIDSTNLTIQEVLEKIYAFIPIKG